MSSNYNTFCNNKNCEIKKDCDRYLYGLMPEVARQLSKFAVAHFVPHYDESGVKCDMFIKKESKQ